MGWPLGRTAAAELRNRGRWPPPYALNNMKDGLDDILQYTMDMLKQRVEDQIDALEDMKDAYSDIIDMKKKSLEASKEEADYEKTKATKLKEIAKIQAQIDVLSLDNSREAKAEKAALLEELAELQEDLADYQADYALDAQEDALDAMEDAYNAEKDAEIDTLEDSISSYQKLYDLAIEYIGNNWDTLYSELISWNYNYGSNLESEITTAWDNCLAAAQRYGSYVDARNSIDGDITANSTSGSNLELGQTNYDNSYSDEDSIHAIIKEMYQNSQLWLTAGKSEQNRLSERNLELGSMLSAYGVNADRGNDGAWYVDSGELLFDKYKKYIYHQGGFAGEEGTLKDNEILAKLEKGEPVLTEQMWDNLTKIIERIDKLSDAFSNPPSYIGTSMLPNLLRGGSNGTVNNVTNNSTQPVQITIGDTIIHGTSNDTVKQHIEVNRTMINQIAKILKEKM